MPPQRTMPPAKALKTERTHEENQERAYIAASRRSDRSLEARVESARRASEIHKRRTGRALRVTEQDVVNEEMYEEEDDDLPMQYRRLTAHLQTGSADFDRRLSNYLTNHVAMRSALDQAITNAYAQQYPDAPQFAHNNQNGYPSPFAPQVMQQQQQQQQPQTQRSPPSFQPYPTPGTPGYRPGHAARSASMSQSNPPFATSMPAPTSVTSTPPIDPRRASGSPKSNSHSPAISNSSAQLMQRNLSRTQTSPTIQMAQSQQQQQQQHQQRQQQLRRMSAPVQPLMQRTPSHHQAQPIPQSQQMPFQGIAQQPNISPFTTSLPTESQMLLGPGLDMNDPTTAMLMAGSEDFPMPFDLNTEDKLKSRSMNPTFSGMSTTLAPSALDMTTTQRMNQSQIQSGMGLTPDASTAGMQFGLDNSMSEFTKVPNHPTLFHHGGSSQGSDGSNGLESTWDAFINDGSWAENST